MELTEHQLEILQLIHDADGHGIPGHQFARYAIEYPDFHDVVQSLLRVELLEYELKEDTYYLTYEGFEVLEAEVVKPRQTVHTDYYSELNEVIGSFKELQRTALIAVFSIGILVTLFFYFNPELLKKNRVPNVQLEQEVIEQMKLELQRQVDSLQSVGELDSIKLSKEN